MKNKYEEIGGTYREENGIMYPNLALPEQCNCQIGKYGKMHLDYLKQHSHGRYSTLLGEGRLGPTSPRSTNRHTKCCHL